MTMIVIVATEWLLRGVEGKQAHGSVRSQISRVSHLEGQIFSPNIIMFRLNYFKESLFIFYFFFCTF